MSDACTLWPDRLGSLDWSACCFAHDHAYAIGAAKFGADIDLMVCVAHAGGWPMALVMFCGVAVFGAPFWLRAQRKPPRTD